MRSNLHHGVGSVANHNVDGSVTSTYVGARKKRKGPKESSTLSRYITLVLKQLYFVSTHLSMQ